MLKELENNIKKPSLEEQNAFYRKNKKFFVDKAGCHLEQILVKKEKLAQSLHKKITQGASFEKLSRIYSLKKDPGWVAKGSLPVFDKACFGQKKNLSPVLQSPYGYHLFLIKGRKTEQQKSFQQSQKQIILFLKEKNKKEQFQIWLKKESSQTSVWTNKKLLNTNPDSI